jgi:hypothetical protein
MGVPVLADGQVVRVRFANRDRAADGAGLARHHLQIDRGYRAAHCGAGGLSPPVPTGVGPQAVGDGGVLVAQ